MAEETLPGIVGEFIELRRPDGRTAVGRLVPREGCELALTLPSSETATLQRGDRVELGSLPPLELLRLCGTVTAITRTDTKSLVIIMACTETFHWHPHFFERRNAVRVRPSLLEPATGAILVGKTLAKGRVRDLSIEDVALVVSEGARSAVVVPSNVDLMLRLPRSTQDLRIAASVLRSEDEGTATVFCMRFDPQRSRAFSAAQRELQSYVLRRQADLVVPRDPSAARRC